MQSSADLKTGVRDGNMIPFVDNETDSADYKKALGLYHGGGLLDLPATLLCIYITCSPLL